jgi:hypothetical protein
MALLLGGLKLSRFFAFWPEIRGNSPLLSTYRKPITMRIGMIGIYLFCIYEQSKTGQNAD